MTETVENTVDSFSSHVFFASDGLRAALNRASRLIVSDINSLKVGIDTEQGVVMRFVAQAVAAMNGQPEAFDTACSFNIKHIGEQFRTDLQQYLSYDRVLMADLLSACYRFITEFEIKSKSVLPDSLSTAWNRLLLVDLSTFSESLFSIKFAQYHMPIYIMREYITHPHMQALSELPAAIHSSQVTTEIYQRDLKERENRANALAKNLEGYTSQLNFLGLAKGFQQLRGVKETERKWSLRFIRGLGVVLVALPVAKILNWLPTSDVPSKEIAGGIAIVALELMLIYFFRITLQNFRSVKAQLLQLDLRVTLCQFIEGYTKFAKEAKKDDDKEILTRFEQVVFSSIVTDETGIPSTFDGIEQISGLIERLKK